MISNDIHKRLDPILKKQLLLKLLNIVCAAYCIAKYRPFLSILLPFSNLNIVSSPLNKNQSTEIFHL